MITWILWVVVLVLLYFKYRGGIKCLPEHLRWQVHKDYFFPFIMIPRFLTSYGTKPPKLLWGYNVTYWGEHDGIKFPHPIQNKLNGKWCAIQICWLPYFEITFKNGYYFYFGFRYDGVDYYSTFPGCDISPASGFEP